MQITPRFIDLLAIYRAELLKRVVPFWSAYTIDRQNGSILTCISDEGQILSTDKYMWSQLRAIWTFSALYNKIEPKQEWFEVAPKTGTGLYGKPCELPERPSRPARLVRPFVG